MSGYATMTTDLIAESISKSVSDEIGSRKHSYKIASFKQLLPTDEEERKRLLESIVKQLKRILGKDVDVFVTDDAICIEEL